MLHAVDPLTAILGAVGVRVCAVTVLLIELIFTLVLTPILPDIVTIPVHHAILELALKIASVGPLEASVAAHLVVRPLAAVLAAVGPEVDAFTLLNTVLEETVIVASIAPYFDPLAVLLVLCRHLGSVLDRVKVILNVKANVLSENTKACLSVLLPETLVQFFSAHRGSEHSKSTSLAINPITFKRTAIWPN